VDRIAVLGVGLIGGSLGLAARTRAGARVTGFDSDPQALALALERGAIDAAASSIAQATEGAQAVFVTVPIGVLSDTVTRALFHAPADCVVSDAGSTKRAVVAAHADPRFVGGHPLAGAETAGVQHARAEMFEGATWYLTPTPETSGILYERLHRLLRSIGARPCAIDPDTHDRLLAGVSHLPHVLANVLVARAAGALREEGERLPATGPSFRDATRVAGAPSGIWTDIYLSNREAVRTEIDGTIERLKEVGQALDRGDRKWIQDWNERAATDRRALLEGDTDAGRLVELRVSVPNRPGVIAELALELGRAGVNIADLALYPAPDMSEGVVALWVGGEQEATRALELVAGLGYPVAPA